MTWEALNQCYTQKIHCYVFPKKLDLCLTIFLPVIPLVCVHRPLLSERGFDTEQRNTLLFKTYNSTTLSRIDSFCKTWACLRGLS